MGFKEKDCLKYYCFNNFSDDQVVQGIFTRKGGVSPAPWNSLNLGGTVGDSRSNVIENRRRIFEVMEREVPSIFDVWQVHGTNVICTNEPRPLDAPHAEADAILTNSKEITLFMRFADCVPVFLYDPEKKVVGLVHAGWQGTVKKICEVTVQTMQKVYGCEPKNILAGIGPSIGVERYEVGEVVIQQVQKSFGADEKYLLPKRNSGIHFDLWTANRLTLENSGLNPNHIEVSGICTASNTQDWYSHRRENGKTGRFGALIALK